MGDNEESTNSEKVLIVPLSEESRKITQILSNEKAMKMLEILADKPMSASDVAEKLDLPLTTVKYNLDGLIEADLIQVKETKWSRKGREVKIYEPVQKLIVVAPGSMKKDRASVISMLKKYLGLVAGAVFAATGLEAITRSFGTRTTFSQEAATTAPLFAEDEAMDSMNKGMTSENPVEEMAEEPVEVMEETEAIPEMEADEFTGSDALSDGDSMDTVLEEGTVVDYADYDVPTEVPTDAITDAGDIAPDMLAASTPNGTDAGAEVLREGMNTGAGNQTSPMVQTFSDNMSSMAEPAGSLFHDGILSHISVWFFFGCLFIITLLFVREMYNRKKNI